MALLTEVGEVEAPQQGSQRLLPPTASASRHSRTCSVPLALPLEHQEVNHVTAENQRHRRQQNIVINVLTITWQ
jgi:hypothetical protein